MKKSILSYNCNLIVVQGFSLDYFSVTSFSPRMCLIAYCLFAYMLRTKQNYTVCHWHYNCMYMNDGLNCLLILYNVNPFINPFGFSFHCMNDFIIFNLTDFSTHCLHEQHPFICLQLPKITHDFYFCNFICQMYHYRPNRSGMLFHTDCIVALVDATFACTVLSQPQASRYHKFNKQLRTRTGRYI